MTAPRLRRLPADRAGATAVEFAMLLPVLLAFVLGTMEIGRMAWTQAALTFAVEEAARCAAVTPAACANVAKFASKRVASLNIPESAFTYTTSDCGQQVSASVSKGYLVYAITDIAPPITARACHP